MVKTFVLGANGGVGHYLVQLLKDNHQEFTAGSKRFTERSPRS